MSSKQKASKQEEPVVHVSEQQGSFLFATDFLSMVCIINKKTMFQIFMLNKTNHLQEPKPI